LTALSSKLKFKRKGGDGTCTLRAGVNHLSKLLRTRFSQLGADGRTVSLLKHMAFALEVS